MHTRLQGKRCSLQKYVVVDRPNSFSDTENSKKCILKYIISYYPTANINVIISKQHKDARVVARIILYLQLRCSKLNMGRWSSRVFDIHFL